MLSPALLISFYSLFITGGIGLLIKISFEDTTLGVLLNRDEGFF
jgi:hypothetical protein